MGKNLLIILLLAASLAFSASEPNETAWWEGNWVDPDPNILYSIYTYEYKLPEVNWIGSPRICNWDGNWLNEGCMVDYQIGLREDGVVVWRLTP